MNRTWYDVAALFLYDTLTIKFSDSASLERAVAGAMGRGRYVTYARRLNLVAVDKPGRTPGYRRRPAPARSLPAADFIPNTVGSFIEKHLTHRHHPGLDVIEPEPAYYQDKDWGPLEFLISNLRRLSEFHYAVDNAFPGCLLQAVHKYHPTCQLSIWSFQHLSLDQPGLGRSQNVFHPMYEDQFDMEVLRSPCLHAIKILYSVHRDSDSREQTQQHEIVPLIAMAPNLKHIELRLESALSEEDFARIKKDWEKFATSIEPLPSANLGSFSFLTPTAYSKESTLLKWSQLIDLSHLRSLNIDNVRVPARMRDAVSRLVNLERLFISANPFPRDWETHEENLMSIFDCINPLKYIRIRELHRISFLHKILVRHGKSLQGLIVEPAFHAAIIAARGDESGYVYPAFDHVEINRLVESCPQLEELGIPIQRFKGDLDECRSYKALGKFPKLHSLILDLAYHPRKILARGMHANEASLLKDAFINAAVDETLVMSIWDMISRSQQTHRLRHLRCAPFGGGLFGIQAWYAHQQRCRSFLATRGGYHSTDAPEIVEIGKEERQAQYERHTKRAGGDASSVPVSPMILGILCSIWPPKSERSDWRTDWESFPLRG